MVGGRAPGQPAERNAGVQQEVPAEIGTLPTNFHHAAYLPGSAMAERCQLPSKLTALTRICSSGMAALTCRRNILRPSRPRGSPTASRIALTAGLSWIRCVGGLAAIYLSSRWRPYRVPPWRSRGAANCWRGERCFRLAFRRIRSVDEVNNFSPGAHLEPWPPQEKRILRQLRNGIDGGSSGFNNSKGVHSGHRIIALPKSVLGAVGRKDRGQSRRTAHHCRVESGVNRPSFHRTGGP